jgi:hypothetical protein
MLGASSLPWYFWSLFKATVAREAIWLDIEFLIKIKTDCPQICYEMFILN